MCIAKRVKRETCELHFMQDYKPKITDTCSVLSMSQMIFGEFNVFWFIGSSQKSWDVGAFMIPILEMGKLRPERQISQSMLRSEFEARQSDDQNERPPHLSSHCDALQGHFHTQGSYTQRTCCKDKILFSALTKKILNLEAII